MAKKKESKQVASTSKKSSAGNTSAEKVEVEFLKSPTGLLNLGYHPGETGLVSRDQADILIDAGIAKEVS